MLSQLMARRASGGASDDTSGSSGGGIGGGVSALSAMLQARQSAAGGGSSSNGTAGAGATNPSASPPAATTAASTDDTSSSSSSATADGDGVPVRGGMLAELMAKRSRAGSSAGAGPLSSPPAASAASTTGGPASAAAAAGTLPKPAKKPAHRNPCVIADRRAFVYGVLEFAESASVLVARTEAKVAAAEAAATELALYFGEDPRVVPPSKVFAVLRQFSREFNSSLLAYRKSRERAAKNNAKAAADAASHGEGSGGPVGSCGLENRSSGGGRRSLRVDGRSQGRRPLSPPGSPNPPAKTA